jgi:hypothetical protein
MTELEMIERAKMYMEKLANGINPIDDSVIPDQDTVNNVRLSRCFFYVADVLRQLMDNGGLKQQRSTKKLPFSLSMEDRARFEYSQSPIPVSEISKRINVLTSEGMKPLTYKAIRDWLTSLELLADVQDADGKMTKRPTPRGESMGILLETRNGRNGVYFVVVYNIDAQRFILDNLDAVVAFKSA